MKKLIVDIGNSSIKLVVFEGDVVLDRLTLVDLSDDALAPWLQAHRRFATGIVASVRHPEYTTQAHAILAHSVDHLYSVKDMPRAPLVNRYEPPRSLGDDRWAAAIGAHYLYPDSNVLVVDAGTALTYELVLADGQYMGGMISPGLSMRFSALHQGTAQLPWVAYGTTACQLVGQNTADAIAFGVINGLMAELKANMEQYSLKYSNLKVLFTGGDAFFLAEKLKTAIFVVRDLVLIGLNRLLEYNVGQE